MVCRMASYLVAVFLKGSRARPKAGAPRPELAEQQGGPVSSLAGDRPPKVSNSAGAKPEVVAKPAEVSTKAAVVSGAKPEVAAVVAEEGSATVDPQRVKTHVSLVSYGSEDSDSDADV